MPESNPNTSLYDPYEALRLPSFRLYLAARFVLTTGVLIQSVVVAWQVYEITRDPLSLGIIGLCEILPAITVSLYAGHVADTADRRKILLITSFLFLLCWMALALTALPQSPFPRSVELIYAIVFVRGIGRGFFAPAVVAYLSQVAPRRLYANAATWNSTNWQLAAVLGPALGGLLIGFLGAAWTYLIVAALTVLGILLLWLLKPAYPQEIKKSTEPLSASLSAGVKFVFAHPLILSAISLDLFAVLFGGAISMLPIYAAEILHVGAQGFGFLRAAPSLGAASMALYLALFPLRQDAGKILLAAVAGFGGCMIVFGISQSFYLSLAVLALSGALDNVSVVIRSTIIQTLTPDEMRGRVAAVNQIFIGSSNEIGEFESGVAARLLGVVPSVVFGGCMTMVVVAITAWRAPQLVRLQQITADAEIETQTAQTKPVSS